MVDKAWIPQRQPEVTLKGFLKPTVAACIHLLLLQALGRTFWPKKSYFHFTSGNQKWLFRPYKAFWDILRHSGTCKVRHLPPQGCLKMPHRCQLLQIPKQPHLSLQNWHRQSFSHLGRTFWTPERQHASTYCLCGLQADVCCLSRGDQSCAPVSPLEM